MGVVVPAHDEEELLPGCLASLRVAADAARPRMECRLVVVADACGDGTVAVAVDAGAVVVETAVRRVGAARAAGVSAALASGAQRLATTDADSVVPADWIVRLGAHFDAGADVVVGTVAVADWSIRPDGLRPVYELRYAVDVSVVGHRHVHGANLGFTAAAYRAVGGFRSASLHEDVSFVAAAETRGLRVVYATDVVVITSARRHARLYGGFATHLTRLEALVPEEPTIATP